MLSRWPRSEQCCLTTACHQRAGQPGSVQRCQQCGQYGEWTVDTVMISCVRVQEVPRKQLSVGKIRAAELPIVWVLGNGDKPIVQYPHCRLTIWSQVDPAVGRAASARFWPTRGTSNIFLGATF